MKIIKIGYNKKPINIKLASFRFFGVLSFDNY